MVLTGPESQFSDGCGCCGAGRMLGSPRSSFTCPVCGGLVSDVARLLTRIQIPMEVIELVPWSVAVGDGAVPFAYDGDVLWIAIDFSRGAVISSRDAFDKLRFILNRKISLAHATSSAIKDAIDRAYRE